MPIYVYKSKDKGCPTCKAGFEVMQSMSAEPLKSCPDCGGEVSKVPAAVAGGVQTLSNANLRDKGFTKFENRGDAFERVT